MEVQLTPDQQAFVRQAIDNGRLRGPEEAVQEAMSLWEERERRRFEILSAVDEAEHSVAQGLGTVVTDESMPALAERVQSRGRLRMAESILLTLASTRPAVAARRGPPRYTKDGVEDLVDEIRSEPSGKQT